MAPLLRFAALIALLSAQLSSASWVKFCNDAECKDCGQWVNTGNSGCLNENGRVAIYFKGYKANADEGWADLRAYDEPDCNCEKGSTCKPKFGDSDYMGFATSGCFPVPKGKSYRFADCGKYCS